MYWQIQCYDIKSYPLVDNRSQMPVLHRWDSDEASGDRRPAAAWRYDETTEDSSSSSGEGSTFLGPKSYKKIARW